MSNCVPRGEGNGAIKLQALLGFFFPSSHTFQTFVRMPAGFKQSCQSRLLSRRCSIALVALLCPTEQLLCFRAVLTPHKGQQLSLLALTVLFGLQLVKQSGIFRPSCRVP